MTQMKFTKRVQFGLFAGLIALNIILRIPTTPHEIGLDSFFIHVLANSVSAFGEAKWWVNPWSIVGFYPLSYASTLPFILSGISQCTAMNVELVILLYGMILGIFSIFVAYTLAGAIWDNDSFKFLVAFIFSTSSCILTYSTWTATTRTLFVIVLPLFIYLLLKTQTFKVRYSILTFVIFMLLFATHNYITFMVPIVLSYFIVVIFYMIGKYINIKPIKNSENLVNIVALASFLIMVLMPFFVGRAMWMNDPETFRAGMRSRYALLDFMFQNYTRYVGILIIFLVGGIIYLIFKRNKRFEEWSFLVVVTSLAPFLYISTYMKWFVATFTSPLIGIALMNIATAGTHIRNKKIFLTTLVIILLSSIIFAGYYQDVHFIVNPPHVDRYMKEQTYIGGLWIRDNIDKNLFYDDGMTALRTSAVSGVPTLQGGTIGLTYGFYNSINDISILKTPPSSFAYYRHGPYVRTPGTYYIEERIRFLSLEKFNSRIGKSDISRYNLSYVIENEGIADNVFIRSVHRAKDNLYDNGKIRIWNLD